MLTTAAAAADGTTLAGAVVATVLVHFTRRARKRLNCIFCKSNKVIFLFACRSIDVFIPTKSEHIDDDVAADKDTIRIYIVAITLFAASAAVYDTAVCLINSLR